MNSEHLKAKLTPIFAQQAKYLTAVYLFGSQAEGGQSSRSDVDIALLLNTQDKKIASGLKLTLYTDFSRALHRNDIDIVVLSLAGNLVLNDQIIRKGKLLYSANDDQRLAFEVSLLHRCIDFKRQRLLVMGV